MPVNQHMKYEKQSLRTLGNHDAVRGRLMENCALVEDIFFSLETLRLDAVRLDKYKKQAFYGNPETYSAILSDCEAVDKLRSSIGENHSIDLLNSAIGKITEAVEFANGVFDHLFEGKPLDKTNLIEEIGDGFWYDAIAANALGVSFEEIQEINLAKLKKRYPEKFTEECANVRDLDAERQVLEGGK